MSDLNLLPCPFCGGAPSILSSDMAAWACCTGCEAEGPALDTKKEAALAWNRRAAPIAAQLDQPEQPKSAFLNHLAESGKAIEGWPAWKTGLWNSDQAAQLDQDAERAEDEQEALADLRKAVQAGASNEWLLLFVRQFVRRAAPVAAQLDAELPPLPERDGDWAGDDWFTADSMRDYARQVVAPYAERIRLLEREYGLLSLVADQLNARVAAADAHIERLEAAERQAKQPAQSIDTPEFRALVEWWAGAAHSSDKYTRTVRAKTEWAKLIAYIDGRTAGAAPEGWQAIENAPTNMARRLYLVGGFCVQGFVDATGELMVQSEVSPHWRKMRGKPTHWMPLPAAPSPQENTK